MRRLAPILIVVLIFVSTTGCLEDDDTVEIELEIYSNVGYTVSATVEVAHQLPNTTYQIDKMVPVTLEPYEHITLTIDGLPNKGPFLVSINQGSTCLDATTVSGFGMSGKLIVG